jgi:hypothetical protein
MRKLVKGALAATWRFEGRAPGLAQTRQGAMA